MNSASQPAIQAQNLKREYSPSRGVSGITLNIPQGECFALLGRNGSGKSTFTRLLLGLEGADSGALTVLGCSVKKGSREHLAQVGVAMDRSVHWEHLSGWDNAYFVARSCRMAPRAIHTSLQSLMDLADLKEQAHDPVKTYSFGMRRKLSIIQALCHSPELLVLDEPTAGLDPQFMLRLGELVEARTQNRKTTWIASNDPNWIAPVATGVGFMKKGKILASGSVESLVSEVSDFQEIKVQIAGQTRIAHPDHSGVRSFTQNGETLTALLDSDPALVPRTMEWIVSQGGAIKSLEVRQATLRDAFLLKTGGALEE